MKSTICSIPVIFNIIGSLVYKLHARSLLLSLGMDARLAEDGLVKYHFGVGSVSQLVMIGLLIISIAWILINAKIFYTDRQRKKEYLIICISLVVVMDVCWMMHYLDWYPLTGIQIFYEQPPM